jgi:hypothetical protein
MKIRITKNTYYDEYGNPKDSYFTVERQKKFLRWNYWSSYKKEECDTSGSYKTTIAFKSMEDAEEFVRKVVIENQAFDGWRTEIVKNFEINEKNNNFSSDGSDVSLVH